MTTTKPRIRKRHRRENPPGAQPGWKKARVRDVCYPHGDIPVKPEGVRTVEQRRAYRQEWLAAHTLRRGVKFKHWITIGQRFSATHTIIPETDKESIIVMAAQGILYIKT